MNINHKSKRTKNYENSSSFFLKFTASDWDNYNAQYGKAENTEIYTILLNNRRLRNIDKEGTALKITSI